MKLSEVKQNLESLEELRFRLPDGSFVPVHFHVTEIGLHDKHFIDCGGTVRHEKSVSFQLWYAGDTDHRLEPAKLLDIIALSERTLGIPDLEVDVEYQSDTIGTYGLRFAGEYFQLTSKQTACLASDACGIPVQKQRLVLAELPTCKPGGKCC